MTITSAGEEGEGYAESALLAKLSAGGSYTITNFEGTGNDVVITVESISTATSPGVANVRIEYAGVSCDGTPSPTPAPSQSPSKSPTSKFIFYLTKRNSHSAP